MQVDFGPLKDASMMYADIAGCNMVEAIIEVVEGLSIKVEVEAEADVVECQMVDITKDADYIKETTPEPRFDEKWKAAHLFAENDISTMLSRRTRTLGMYEWAVMSFGSKNIRITYQKMRKVIVFDPNEWNKITVYAAEMKSRKP